MKNNIKNIVITIGFVSVLLIVFLINILKQDKEVSISERRKLAQFPEITIEKLVNGKVSEKLDEYVTDQFIERDSFRKIKSFFSVNIMRQKDNNGLFEKDGAIYKIEYPLNENNVNKSIDKIKEIYEKYLQGMNVYYVIIPDKNYYLENDDHLKIDYNRVKQIAESKLKDLEYIDIWDKLELEDYYKTDLHWRQEKLKNVVKEIQNRMGTETEEEINYTKISKGDFYGTYYGQLGLNLKPDEMYILTNDIIEKCETYNYENNKKGKVYDEKASNDKYDVYLSGATPLITIDNPNANTGKELIIFRDSFGSSIAPLFIQDYSKITLVDIRYMVSSILADYIEFDNQDVLFIYNTLVLNQNVFK